MEIKKCLKIINIYCDLEGIENYWCLKSQLDYQFNVKKSISEEQYKKLRKCFRQIMY